MKFTIPPGSVHCACALTHAPRIPPLHTPNSARAAVLEAAERAATRRAQEALLQALVETGGKDELLARLRDRLQDAGWAERVREHIKGKGGGWVDGWMDGWMDELLCEPRGLRI